MKPRNFPQRRAAAKEWRKFKAAWREGAAKRGRFGHVKTAGALIEFLVRAALYNLGWRLTRFGGWLARKTDPY